MLVLLFFCGFACHSYSYKEQYGASNKYNTKNIYSEITSGKYHRIQQRRKSLNNTSDHAENRQSLTYAELLNARHINIVVAGSRRSEAVKQSEECNAYQ